MKTSIRSKFNIGILFFFFIIASLSIVSALYLNQLSNKTNAILKENHYSVLYAREMQENLTHINQEFIQSILTNRNSDSLFINKELKLFNLSLQLEKNNITEPGEDKLVFGIEICFDEYRDSTKLLAKLPKTIAGDLYLQKKFENLYQQLALLSQMNEKAIEIKTNDAKVTAKNALIQMTIIGAICFLIALGFTYSFASYFNERFFQLYNGIKEIVSSNYGQRLFFEGKDEFYEISLIFNEMAEKLSENNQKMSLYLQTDLEKDSGYSDLKELKKILINLKSIEEEATELISKLEK